MIRIKNSKFISYSFKILETCSKELGLIFHLNAKLKILLIWTLIYRPEPQSYSATFVGPAKANMGTFFCRTELTKQNLSHLSLS